MISVGSGDRRKRLVLGGFGGGIQRKMEEAELEEGEACSFQNGDDDTNIDPDVALSYIDEKLQNVLGHFKKDFEGGISSENLGSKYGGYGSFLSQQSPVWCSSRSPANVQNSHAFRSPTSLQLEQGKHSSLTRANGPCSLKHAFTSSSSAYSHPQKAPLSHVPLRQNSWDQVRHASQEPKVKGEVADKSANFPDQRTFKVRIKVGSDNMSAKKNAAIYSGLGLDDSPSSSFDGSPVDCQSMSQCGADESPTQIIQIMTSFPIYGGHLLSPLPEGLARLTEKLLQDSTADAASKRSKTKDVVKLVGKVGLARELKKGGDKESIDSFDWLLNKEADFNALAYEELVSKALKLPLLSSTHDISGKPVKDGLGGSSFAPCEGDKNGTALVKSNLFFNMLKQESLGPVSISDDDLNKKQNSKVCSARKVADVRKLDLRNDVPSHPARGGDGKGEPANSSNNSDVKIVGSRGSKASNTDVKDPQEQRVGKTSTSFELDGVKLHPGSKQFCSKGKKKQKGSQYTDSRATEIPKLSCKNGPSWYKDFFGEINDEGDDLMDSPEMPLVDGRLKIPCITEKDILQDISTGERSTSKGANEQSISRVHPNQAPNIAYPSKSGPPISDPAPVGIAVKDDWVCCDKCQKWRLLPLGFVETLPDKWLCSMLNWLPGMNSCSVNEEDTTKAVRERYQLPAQNINGLHGPLPGVLPGVPASSGLHSCQHNQDNLPGGVKKNHAVKEVAKPALQHSVKSKSLGDPVRSEENELHFQQMRSSIDAVSETSQRKKKSKKKSLGSYFDGGYSKNKKLKCEKEPGRDYARASKKMKTGGTLSDENWISSHNQGDYVLVHCLSNNVPSNGAGNCHLINCDSSSSRTSKWDMDDSLPDSTKKSKSLVQASLPVNPLDMRKLDSDNAAIKERKASNLPSAPSPIDLSGKVVSENEQIRPKKARISKPKEKNSSSGRGSSKADKKSKSSRGSQLGTHVEATVQSLQDNRSMKKDLGSSATSCSSKAWRLTMVS